MASSFFYLVILLKWSVLYIVQKLPVLAAPAQQQTKVSVNFRRSLSEDKSWGYAEVVQAL